jgi:photosystem II stability/assembly factor-like uncharacterized protein
MNRKISFCLSMVLAGTVCAQTIPSSESFLAPLSKDSLLLDITSIHEGKYLAVGERGHILSSQDGLRWQQQAVPTTSTLTAVTHIENSIWVVGHDSVILKSEDGGVQWQSQQFLPELERPLMDVHFQNKLHGIAVGAYGTFYRTEDGGENWTEELHSEFLSIDDQEYLVEIKEEDEAFYEEELTSILPHLNRIYQDDEKLYIVGEVGLVATSTDFGRTWQRLDIDYIGSFFAVNKTPAGTLMVGGLRGNIFALDERTNTWQNIATDVNSSVNSLVVADTTRMIAIGNNGDVVVIDNGQVKHFQTDEGQDLISGAIVNDQLITVTEAGIQHISLK